MNAYSTIKTRVTSRFTKNNVLYGKMFMVSSKRSEHDFLEAYVAKMKNEKMLIVDEPQWVIKPQGTFDSRTFPVAVGNRSLKSRVLDDDISDEEKEAIIKQGYRILDVPLNFKDYFKLDLNKALMDLAGISVVGAVSFFNYDMFSKCYIKDYKNPFVSDILTIGIHDDLNIADFFEIDKIPMQVRYMPQFIHVDGSLTGDKTGISSVAVSGLKETQQYNGANEFTSTEMTYKHVFSVDIEAPQGSEISFEKTRNFIYYLKASGFNIIGVSLDGFQSADMKQMLLSQGYNATIISLDKSPQGYLALRSAMNDGRIGLIQIDLLEKELIQLQRDVQTGKIDHPPDGCFTDDTEILLYDTIHNRNTSKTIKSLLNAPDVRNYNVKTVSESGEIEIHKIKSVFHTKDVDRLLCLTFSDEHTVKCTPEHKFMLADGTFIEAQNLFIGIDELKSVKSKSVYVYKKEYINLYTPVPVYDLEIDTIHNFPLQNGVVVHNSKDMADSLAGALFNASINKQSLIDSRELLESALDINNEIDPKAEFMADMQESMMQSGYNKDNMSKLASDRLDDLLNGYGSENIVSW